ncbi:MAG TPA: metal-sensing transcriptional repressor [Dehalococcoidales bacterium]|nr:metal-sensing transcriptional repressor [Dehalococcoidales bacterium]
MKNGSPGTESSSQFHHHRQTKAVINRLSRIEGHVRAIKHMLEEGKACPDILIQFAAVKAALQKTAQIVLEDHIESCLRQATSKGQASEEWASLKEALHKYIV